MLELLLNNSFLLSVVAFAIILIPAIIIHELGHFIAAKMVGINVLEFGIGFPPRIARLFMWGETEFTLNWLPIGGFVRPLGEDMIGPVVEDEPETIEYDDDGKPKHIAYISEREELMARGVPESQLQSVNDTKPFPRIWFMLAGAVFNVISAIIFFIIAALFGIETPMGSSIIVAQVPPSSALDQAIINQGDAIEMINGDYFADNITFFETWNQAATDQTPIELTLRRPIDYKGDNGRAWEHYTVNVTPDAQTITPYVLVTFVAEASPAQEAGLQPQDKIIAIAGEPVSLENPLTLLLEAASQSAGTPLTLTFLRDGERQQTTLTPRVDPPKGQGRIGIGITAQWQFDNELVLQWHGPALDFIPRNIGDAITYGFEQTGTVLELMASLPMQLLNGTVSGEEARPVSVVGISQIGGTFLQRSIIANAPSLVLNFIAIISIALGITNLLPIPALDGGRILFVLIEIIRGKPVPPRIENAVNRVGIIILLLIGALVILLDIFKPVI